MINQGEEADVDIDHNGRYVRVVGHLLHGIKLEVPKATVGSEAGVERRRNDALQGVRQVGYMRISSFGCDGYREREVFFWRTEGLWRR